MAPRRVIGEVVKYTGDPDGEDDHPYLTGHDVRLVAVLRPSVSGDPDDLTILQNDTEVAKAGGVTRLDSLHVQPWISEGTDVGDVGTGGHFSVVSSDVRAGLPCFDRLRAD
jgi:hypothetical protein